MLFCSGDTSRLPFTFLPSMAQKHTFYLGCKLIHFIGPPRVARQYIAMPNVINVCHHIGPARRLPPEMNHPFCHIHVVCFSRSVCLFVITNCSGIAQKNRFQIKYWLLHLFSFFWRLFIGLIRVIIWRLPCFCQQFEPLLKLKSKAEHVSMISAPHHTLAQLYHMTHIKCA